MIEVPQNSTTIITTAETSATTSKKRGEGRRYFCTNSCENLEEAMNLIKDEKIWTVKNIIIGTTSSEQQFEPFQESENLFH